MSVKEYSLKFVKLSKYSSLVYRSIWRRNVGKPCSMITQTFLGGWYMHSRWMRVVREIQIEKERTLGLRIRLVLVLVGVRLDLGQAQVL